MPKFAWPPRRDPGFWQMVGWAMAGQNHHFDVYAPEKLLRD